ncbi:MAG: hypothetical protein WBL93_06965 [Lutisporaceae bacterium]
MKNSMKTIVFIISLLAYFIYSTISSIFVRAALLSGNLSYASIVLYLSSAIGILVILYTQAGVKHYYTSKYLESAKVYLKLPLAKFRLADRLLVYLLPSLSILIPFALTRKLSSITPQSIIFVVSAIIIMEFLFHINNKTMKAFIKDKGIIIKGIDLRLELPFPSNYHNPSGYYPFERIINFLDLNDRILIEQSYDLGTITLKADSEALKQVKGVLLANKVRQKKF